jgi:broad specificity phosphatase PhoE
VTVLLVRHAQAGRREAWKGDDRLRPLSSKGQNQAKALAVELSDFVSDGGDRLLVVSSPYTRCRETVAPLAAALGVGVSEAPELAEGGGRAARRLITDLVDRPAVVCTHGDVIGEVLSWLKDQGVDLGPHPDWAKASTWILDARKSAFRAAHYLPPPKVG